VEYGAITRVRTRIPTAPMEAAGTDDQSRVQSALQGKRIVLDSTPQSRKWQAAKSFVTRTQKALIPTVDPSPRKEAAKKTDNKPLPLAQFCEHPNSEGTDEAADIRRILERVAGSVSSASDVLPKTPVRVMSVKQKRSEQALVVAGRLNKEIGQAYKFQEIIVAAPPVSLKSDASDSNASFTVSSEPWIGRSVTSEDWDLISRRFDNSVPLSVLHRIYAAVRPNESTLFSTFTEVRARFSQSVQDSAAQDIDEQLLAGLATMVNAQVVWRFADTAEHIFVPTATAANVGQFSVPLLDAPAAQKSCCAPHEGHANTFVFQREDGSQERRSRLELAVDPGTGWCAHDLYLAPRICLLSTIVRQPGCREDRAVAAVAPTQLTPRAALDILEEFVEQGLVMRQAMLGGATYIPSTAPFDRAAHLWHISS
jgi:hypothetical protein